MRIAPKTLYNVEAYLISAAPECSKVYSQYGVEDTKYMIIDTPYYVTLQRSIYCPAIGSWA